MVQKIFIENVCINLILFKSMYDIIILEKHLINIIHGVNYMNPDVLDPKNLSCIKIYIQVLNFLSKCLDRLGKNINLYKESNKIDDSIYVLFQTLQSIYEIMPFKLLKKDDNFTFDLSKKPEDNIFYTNIDLSFISSRLIDIITKENTWFFLFNYFFRNAQMHHKHLLDSFTQVGNDTCITHYGIRIMIDNKVRSQKLIKTLFKENETIVKKYDKITIVKKSEQEYEMKVVINISFIFELVNSIKLAFVDGLNELANYIDIINEYDLINKYDIDKNLYKKVINEWLESI